ncbi:MAG: hypothetical protein K2X27_06735 [Candidatus Obscuribacterales bacterium]|nr:hypothetical protein [Candidatus Obscuribacterales bacterium]
MSDDTMNNDQLISGNDELFIQLSSLSPILSSDLSCIVITAKPWRWFGKLSQTLNSIIVDVAKLGPIKLEDQAFESRLNPTNNFQEKVFEQLISAGWTKSQIRCDMSLDTSALKTVPTVDFGLFDPQGNLYLLLESKEHIGYFTLAWMVEAQISRNVRIPSIWYGGTDGIKYYFKHGDSGIAFEQNDVPSYDQLEKFLEDALQQGRTQEQVARPSNLAELFDIFERSGSSRVIVDETIWGRLTAVSKETPKTVSGRQARELFSVILAKLSEKPIKALTAICPSSWCFLQSTNSIRTALSNKLSLAALIEGQGQCPLYGQLRWSVMVLGGDNNETLFDEIQSELVQHNITEQSWYTSATNWLDRKIKPTRGFLSKIKSNEIWHVASNDPLISKFQETVRELGPVASVSEMCDVFLGLPTAKLTVDENPEGICLLTGSGISSKGLLLDESRRVSQESVPGKYRLIAGDIVCRRMTRGKPFFVLVPEEINACATDSTIVIRPKNGTVSSDFICQYLSSDAALRHMISGCSTLHDCLRLSPRDICQLEIPVGDHIFQQSFALSAKVEALIKDKLVMLETDRESCLRSTDPALMRTNLIRLGDNIALLESCLKSVNDFDFQVANFYPFPLAFGYRLLQSIVSPAEKYQEILRVCENLLAFLGSVQMALIKENERPSLKHQPESLWSSGISPGHWRQIIQATGEYLGQFKDALLCQSLSALGIGNLKRPFGKACEEIIVSINDFKHGRGPKTEEEYADQIIYIEQRFRTALEFLSFFARHPIRQIKDINPLRYGTSVNLRCLRYSGDHPGLAQEEVTFPRALTKNDLFIELDQGEWINLHPFIIVKSCPHCRARETYFIDYWATKKKTCRLKSFERGHVEEDSEVAANLHEWQQRCNQ